MGKKEKNKAYLIQMIGFAKERRSYLLKQGDDWDENWYIRIGGNGYCAVSLNEDTPLKGFAKSGGGKKNLETIKGHFKNGRPEKPRRSVPERRMQCSFIKKALAKGGDLKAALGLDNTIYDELLFAVDEISLQDIRCDILAVGVIAGHTFPVLIELKPGREQKRLITQINTFCEKIIGDDYKDMFKELLSECVDKKISMSQIGKMVIWPKNKREQATTIDDFHAAGIDVLEYDWDHSSDINKLKFEPCRYYKR